MYKKSICFGKVEGSIQMKRFILVLSILFFCISACIGDGDHDLFPISVGGKYGYINGKGTIIIQPQYKKAGEFSEGLAPVMINDLWGYINQQGKFIINPNFEYAKSFHDHLALVTKGNHDNFIDKTGKLQFPDVDNDYFDPQEGRIAFERFPDQKWGIIDYSGKLIVDYKFDACYFTGTDFGPNPDNDPYLPYVFLDGLIPVCLNNKYGFIDVNGKAITDCIYDDVRYFQYGLTVVTLNGKSGLIDKSGKYILPLEFDKIGQVTDSFISVSKNGKWGYIDHSGSLVIPYQYDSAESFRAARGKIGMMGADGNLKYGYIDKDGNQVIKPTYDTVCTFDSKGYAIVKIGNKSGVIDKSGKYMISLLDNIDFDPLEGYRNGELQKSYYHDYVQQDILIYYDDDTLLKGFIRIDGKKLTDPIFLYANQFQNDIAKVVQLVGQHAFDGLKTGYIDTTGKYIWKPTR